MRRERVIHFLIGLFFIVGTSRGSLDYTAFGNTMNTAENGGGAPCEVLTESTATFTLEADQSVIAAYLYWAGSGPGDFEVQLNGVPITAERTFADQLDDVRIFFAAYAEVTTQLQETGAGEYTLSDLDVMEFINSDPVICGSGANFAGWAITVIIEDPDLPTNQVNVFDGLESVSQNSPQLDIELENLNVIDNEGASIGFVAWEGDAALAVNETLAVNGNIISNPPLNPIDNQFNSTNSFTESVVLYNMDIDVYDIESNINIGDNSATISLTSGQDFVMINNIITVLNSTLPDAVISLDAATPLACLSQDVLVEYTVTNEGTDILPANTPIAFYTNGIFAGSDQTSSVIEEGASESGSTIITIPAGIPVDFELLLIVDDTGGGNSIVPELNEDNNESQILDVSLRTIAIATPLMDLIVCDDSTNDDIAIFDLTINEDLAIGNQTDVFVNFYLNEEDANANINAIPDPSNYQNISSPQTIYVRIQESDDDLCFSLDTFTLELSDQPVIPELTDISLCDDASNDGLLIFDLTIQESLILSGQEDFNITYHTSFEDAQNDSNAIQNPFNFENSQINEGIYIRLENPFNTDCFDIGNFEINVLTIAPPQELPELLLCNEGFEMAVFDLSLGLENLILSNEEVVTGYYLTTEDAFNEQNAIVDPFVYTNLSNPQTIYIRTDTPDGEICYNLAQVELRVENCPPFVPQGFSPNGDTFNQTFEISGLKDIFVDYELLIYSRLGNIIYRGDNDIPFWDGTPNEGIGGSEAPTGTYFYVLKLDDPNFDDILGWVYLNR